MSASTIGSSLESPDTSELSAEIAGTICPPDIEEVEQLMLESTMVGVTACKSLRLITCERLGLGVSCLLLRLLSGGNGRAAVSSVSRSNSTRVSSGDWEGL